MERLRAHAAELLKLEEVLVLGGDYNVAPTDEDVYDPEGWRDDALCRPESRRALRMIINLGYTDAIRALHGQPHLYTFWDYQAGRWQRDEGLRIDHLLLSPQAADLLSESASTAIRAARTSRRTTRRSGAIWISRALRRSYPQPWIRYPQSTASRPCRRDG